MNIHKIIERTAAEGPGERFCIWVQGCSRRCLGCFNPETWSLDTGEVYQTETLISRILETDHIEGVTFLGGEPMEQAEELSVVAKAVRQAGLSVVCFTGYHIEEIWESGNEAMLALLTQTDLLIDGPYLQEQQDFSRPWVGSRNQRYWFLSDRYGEKDVLSSRNRMEVRFLPNGHIVINGMADATVWAQLKAIGEGSDEEK